MDAELFIRASLAQLDAHLRGQTWLSGNWGLQGLLDRLAACGCVVAARLKSPYRRATHRTTGPCARRNNGCWWVLNNRRERYDRRRLTGSISKCAVSSPFKDAGSFDSRRYSGGGGGWRCLSLFLVLGVLHVFERERSCGKPKATLKRIHAGSMHGQQVVSIVVSQLFITGWLMQLRRNDPRKPYLLG
jgi:hypothetical protein